MIFILDIDGTLAKLDHREHLAEEDNWDDFFDPELVEKDEPIKEAQEVFDKLVEEADEIYFVTGRPESLRETTEDWLEKYYGLKPSKDMLFMRPEGDERKSSELKREIIEREFNKEDKLIMIDDEEENLTMFDTFGLSVLAPDCWEVFS